MKIIYDESICVVCLSCVSESECGGITYRHGKIFVDDSRAEDWSGIADICPVGALTLKDDGENF